MSSPVVESKKRLKISYLLNILLVLLIIAGAIFGYFYYKSINPLQEATTNVLPLGKVPKATFLYSIYGDESKGSVLKTPNKVLVYQDRTYVANGNNNICIFDRNGKTITTFTKKGNQDFTPSGMTIANNQLYVTDMGNRLIRIFDLNGKYIKDFAPKKVFLPLDIDFYQNKFYVLDSAKQIVRVFDDKGNQLFEFGKKSKGKEYKSGEFYFFSEIRVHEDKIYVVDSDNNRIQIFDLKGKFIKLYDKFKDANLYYIPRSMAFDKNGNIYVANSMQHNITVHDKDGKPLTKFTSGENPDDEIMLPNSVFIDNNNNKMYITTYIGNRVLVYQLK